MEVNTFNLQDQKSFAQIPGDEMKAIFWVEGLLEKAVLLGIEVDGFQMVTFWELVFRSIYCGANASY